MILQTEKVVSGYGNIKVIRGVDIKVDEGEIVSIIGRNGVGKSTFVKTLMGLLKTKSGKILFKNADITKTRAYERARYGIGYVPQGHEVFATLTVEENLYMGSRINTTKPNSSLDSVYEYFPKLRERRKQKAGTLSGGEQAALAIGRALVGNPDLLVLDEPSEGIQPSIVDQISDILNKINKELGLTILFVEQHLGLIQQLSHRCYAMDKGMIEGEIKGNNIMDYSIVKSYLTV